MFQPVHLITKNVPGCGVVEGGCLPCSGVSGRAATLYPSSPVDCRFHTQLKIGSLKGASKRAAFVCKASTSGHRRNPDFSRQNRHGFSRNRNRQNEERESFDHLSESDLLSSKNGPLLSLSNTPKFHATASPGPREREIVELFRKVQAQLRERAASKEEKKIETSHGQGKESGTVDSLLKLLRKHSAEQSKRNSRSNGSNKDFSLDQTVQNESLKEGKSTSYYNSNSSLKDDAPEHNASFFTRPVSNFQRKSPVPRVKYQPIYSSEETSSTMPNVNSNQKRAENEVESGLKPERESEAEDLELEPQPEPEPDPEVTFLDGGLAKLSEGETSDINELCNNENEVILPMSDDEDLSALKLPELRALAKTRGLKGYSKMKKSELVDLLSGSLV